MLILALFARLFDLRVFGCICSLFLLVSGKGCGWLLRHSLDFFYYFCHCMSLYVSPGKFFLDSGLTNFWERDCPFGFLLVVF